MAGENTENKNYLGMSDDDFLNATPPGPVVASEDPPAKAEDDKVETTPAVVADAEPETETEKAAAAEEKAEAEVTKAADDPGSKAKEVDGGKVDDKVEVEKTDAEKAAEADKAKPDAKAEGDEKAKADPKAEGDKKDEPKAVDYEGFFKQVMTPFKANGRTIELKTPEEAIRLMQMGAGYGRKIQDLQPALKTIKMLEKADLLDEGKLSFLIDINNKNPDAIKKLIKESGIDPLDLNIGDNVSYSPTSHAVSDKEMAFHSVLDDLQSTPSGTETLRVVNQTWDEASKSLLWESPEVLRIIQDQRESGVYNRIAAEIDRQKLLGQIPPNTPFLQAYKLAGDQLQATNAFGVSETPKAEAQPKVIATRVETPKAQVQNSDKAAAASPTKTAGARAAGAKVNPLSMPDDEFMKTFAGRL